MVLCALRCPQVSAQRRAVGLCGSLWRDLTLERFCPEVAGARPQPPLCHRGFSGRGRGKRVPSALTVTTAESPPLRMPPRA